MASPCLHFETFSVAFRYVANLTPIPQVEAPAQVDGVFFYRQIVGLCFSLLSVQYPEFGSLARTLFLIVRVPQKEYGWSSQSPSPHPLDISPVGFHSQIFLGPHLSRVGVPPVSHKSLTPQTEAPYL